MVTNLHKFILFYLIFYVKADFIQYHCDRNGYHYNGILQWGREVELNSKYSMDKWDFIVKEEGGSHTQIDFKYAFYQPIVYKNYFS